MPAQHSNQKKDRYNLVVIGAGAAGLVSSYIASAVNAKVAMIERHKMGGDCLNYGCVPSKAIIRSAKFLHDVKRHKELGIASASASMNLAEVMDRVHKIIGKIEPHDSIERYAQLGVECLQGEATILDRNTVEINGRRLSTRNIVLAVGGSPLVPKIPGLHDIPYLTSENLWKLRELPRRLLVLGGGPIGCEMAQAFARLGSVVTQVEMGPRLMPREDTDVATAVSKSFAEEGIIVRTGMTAVRVEKQEGGGLLICHKKDSHQTESIPFDKILVAVGRVANTRGKNANGTEINSEYWQKLGISLNENGTFKVDSNLCVNPRKGANIFACGDCVGPLQFTHVAAHQAWYAAVNALFRPFKSFKVDYNVIPRVTFTDPEIAQVGLNELSANGKNIPFELTKYGIDDLDRAIAESADTGFVKVLTVPRKDKILGATIVGQHSGELITEFVTAMKHGIGLNKILGTIHAYPTMSEANKYAAGVWKKNNAPEWALTLVEKFHRWRL